VPATVTATAAFGAPVPGHADPNFRARPSLTVPQNITVSPRPSRISYFIIIADGSDGPPGGVQDCYQGLGGQGNGHHPGRGIHLLVRWRGTHPTLPLPLPLVCILGVWARRVICHLGCCSSSRFFVVVVVSSFRCVFVTFTNSRYSRDSTFLPPPPFFGFLELERMKHR